MSARTLAQREATRRAVASQRARTTARIEDMDFLVQSGVEHTEAALRAGWPSIHAAERALQRRGRTDLARPLGRAVQSVRKAV